ncbi:STM3941 family protein [Lentibacillus cibarius]|uniref:PH domain-containing protein n=1 Tax=Lentibacillus cibarius TaxID=2583219 RepID=A0A5S3QGC2_9BACI|nr:STM3941 family protein [Lentibacillus cibarius]TMN20888.1 hypothetical protein FFL34_01245 [Lentibacillus cibarius]
MEGDNTSTLYFYPSKVKNFFLFVMGLAFIAFGALVCGAAFYEGDYGVSVVGALLALFFGIMVFAIGKGILSSRPYLILTKEALIINAVAKNNAFSIEWDDIIGYNIRDVNFSKFIGIILYDEEKYRARSHSREENNRSNSLDLGLFLHSHYRRFVSRTPTFARTNVF